MSGRKFFVGGNFKANGSLKLINDISTNLKNAKLDPNTEVVVAPPSIFLLSTAEQVGAVGKNIEVAAQNVYDKPAGAYTGEITAPMLVDHNITWVIIGHSERRTLFHETDDLVAAKTKTALANGLRVILCIGETLEQREAGDTLNVCTRQLGAVAKEVSDWKNIVIAYEPVWAIGTGKVATPDQAQEVHQELRQWLSDKVSSDVADVTRIIYGGSVSGKNCRELATKKDIDGFLVGGASLKPEFVDIVNSKV